MDIKDIKVAKKNPRTMGKDAKRALASSLQTFNDISGITVNQRTGNVVSGNHRWEEILKSYSKKDLSLENVKGEFHSLMHKDSFTGFMVRIVNWDEDKELAANVTANSSLVQGEFTSLLQDVLDEISDSVDNSLFESLRLDELQIDMDDIDDLSWEEEQERAEKANNDLPDAKEEKQAGEVKEILKTIRINVPAEFKEEILDELNNFFKDKEYFDKIVLS